MNKLSARMEPFDTFWEAPSNIEKGYRSFAAFYRFNYLKYFPGDRAASILVVSCGPGYMLSLLKKEGYTNVYGIDSDEQKVNLAKAKGLSCDKKKAFEFLTECDERFDVIFCEQEINHLTKDEIVEFFNICYSRLCEGGTIIAHSLNGANPVTGAEALAQNFDHYNSMTEYSLKQVFEYSKFKKVKCYPLFLYVFWTNPINYVLILVDAFLNATFRILFMMYGKKNRIWTKKIGAVGYK